LGESCLIMNYNPDDHDNTNRRENMDIISELQAEIHTMHEEAKREPTWLQKYGTLAVAIVGFVLPMVVGISVMFYRVDAVELSNKSKISKETVKLTFSNIHSRLREIQKLHDADKNSLNRTIKKLDEVVNKKLDVNNSLLMQIVQTMPRPTRLP